MSVIQLEDFSFRYPEAQDYALHKLSLSIEEGSISVLTGKSGSGKSTLLRCLKDEIAPVGQREGSIHCTLSGSEIAIVFQNPDTQLLCGTVWQDLVFPMENRGLSPELMQTRLAETCCFFGIEALLHEAPSALSGGQRQLVALCAALMCEPKLLLLDEPLAQLDPIAVLDFIDLLRRINEELGITILLCEHRLDECLRLADALLVLEKGTLLAADTPEGVCLSLWESGAPALRSLLPDLSQAALQLVSLPLRTPCALKAAVPALEDAYIAPTLSPCVPIVSLRNLVFSYPDGDRPVLRALRADIRAQGITAILGGNGSGKSTLLRLIAGLEGGHLGKIRREAKRPAYLPQSLLCYFSADTVREEIYTKDCDKTLCDTLLARLSLGTLLDRHPYDLSGGECMRVCLASILSQKPDFILLDEPTRGLDRESKALLATLLHESGAAVLLASHDLDFCAQYADSCRLLFDGQLSHDCEPHAFFRANRYYSPAISRALRHVAPDVISLADVARL